MKAGSMAAIAMAFVLMASPVLSVKTRQSTVLAQEAGERPMTKLVNLLKDMAEKTETNAEADTDLFQKYECYATGVIDESAKTIEEMTDAIASGKARIEQLIALATELEAKKAKLERDIKKNEASQAEATAVRDANNEKFKSEEEDMSAGLEQLGQALETLKAVGPEQADKKAAFLQLSANPALVAITDQLQQVTTANEGFLAAQANPGEYKSHSGGVLGILTSTKDTYAKNLEDLRQAEADSLKSYNDLSDTLKAEHKKMSDLKKATIADIQQATEEKTSAEGKLKTDTETKASAEETKAQTEKSLAEKTAVYEERKQLASEEVTAISKAIAILNSDESFDAFGKTSATAGSFLQLSAERSIASSQRQVLSFLRTEARKEQSKRLARLAADLDKPMYRSDAENPFKEVLDEIDEMQDVITKESKADTKKKDWCISERKASNEDKDNQEAEIIAQEKAITGYASDLNKPEEGFVDTLAKAKADLIKNEEDQVEETKQRKAANQEYQTDIANLVTAEELITKAMKTLNAYYDKIKEAALVQTEATRGDDAPDYDKGDYKGNEGGALAMIAEILKDTQDEETAAHKAEQEAQAAFEDSMKALTDDEASLKDAISQTTKDIAETRKEMDEAEGLKKDASEAKANLEAYLLDIKPGCDFIMTNFDKREEHRVAESKALTGAVEKIKGTPAYIKFEEEMASRR